jgi:hypothetical protein
VISNRWGKGSTPTLSVLLSSTYATGERPRVGDYVRAASHAGQGPGSRGSAWEYGHVEQVTRAGALYIGYGRETLPPYLRIHCSYTESPYLFELVKGAAY